MNICINTIDQEAVKYFNNTGRQPRFVILDELKFTELVKTLIPKEPISIGIEEDYSKSDELSIASTTGHYLRVLKVFSKKDLFEVVG